YRQPPERGFGTSCTKYEPAVRAGRARGASAETSGVLAKLNIMKVAILGGGNLGTAIAKGITRQGLCGNSDVIVTRRNTGFLETLGQEGFATGNDNREAVRRSDVIIISVLPQQLDPVLEDIRSDIDPSRHTVISIVTGVSIMDLRRHLGNEVPIVRAMPNTAIAIG